MTKEHFIIYLHSQSTLEASWVKFNESNQILQSVCKKNLNQLITQKESEVIIFAPPEEVLITSVELPKLSRQRTLQALPFALEEQLIDDVSNLHFAICDQKMNGNLPVAIISKIKITTLLDQLAELNLFPSAYIPAIFLLPFEEGVWQINSYENQSIIRTGKFSGFFCETNNLETFLQLKFAEESSSPKLNQTELSPLQLLEKNVSTLSTLDFINLLQGPFQPKPKSSITKKIWMSTFYLLIAFIFFNFFSNIISYFILNEHANQLETAINKIYFYHFPHATSVIAPKERMLEKLQTSNARVNANNLLALLGILGKSLTQSHYIHLKNLEFRDKQLTLNLITNSFDDLDGFKKILEKEALMVKQQNAAIINNVVKATLLIQPRES